MASYNLPDKRQLDLLPPFVGALRDVAPGAVALFDADGTLWRDDTADDFTKWMIDSGHISGDDWPRYLEIYRDDHAAGCRFLLSLYKGLSQETLHRHIWAWWRGHAERKWIPEALESLYFLAEAGCRIWIVTGSPSDTMFPLKDFLPVHEVVGMDFELDDAGIVTGNHQGISCADDGKAEKVRFLLAPDDRVIFAAGNGSLDRAMMELSTKVAWAVFPNATFEALALERNWPILPRPADFIEEAKLA